MAAKNLPENKGDTRGAETKGAPPAPKPPAESPPADADAPTRARDAAPVTLGTASTVELAGDEEKRLTELQRSGHRLPRSWLAREAEQVARDKAVADAMQPADGTKPHHP